MSAAEFMHLRLDDEYDEGFPIIFFDLLFGSYRMTECAWPANLHLKHGGAPVLRAAVRWAGMWPWARGSGGPVVGPCDRKYPRCPFL